MDSWCKSRDNNVMHAKSGLRVVLKWKIYRPDSVITAVIRLDAQLLRFHTDCLIGCVDVSRDLIESFCC